MSGRHARAGVSRRSAFLLSVATLLGLWFGVSAPDVSPVSAPAPPAAVVQPAAPPVAPALPDTVQPPRGGRR